MIAPTLASNIAPKLSLKQKISAIPDGAGALFFIQIFATLGFAVLYSTLVLYATKKLNFTAKDATAIMGGIWCV